MPLSKEDQKIDVTIPLLLRSEQAAKMIGVSRSTFWKWVSEGKFKPIKLGSRITVFRYRDIEAWVNQLEHKEL